MDSTKFFIYVNVDPHFSTSCVPTRLARLAFWLLLLENHLKKNGLESPLIFVFILKGKTK